VRAHHDDDLPRTPGRRPQSSPARRYRPAAGT
jgi:hypothetical protein